MEKELKEYLKSKTKEEVIDLYLQKTFETKMQNFMIEDLQKDIEHLTDATNYYYDENNKFKRQLAEKDLRIEELESQFDYECECNKQFVDCQNENTQLKQQLAEKDVELSLARNEIDTLKHNLNISQEHDNVMCEEYFKKCKQHNQDKISFATEQLEKVKEIIDKNYFYNMSSDCCTFDKLEVDFQINNQIKELRG